LEKNEKNNQQKNWDKKIGKRAKRSENSNMGLTKQEKQSCGSEILKITEINKKWEKKRFFETDMSLLIIFDIIRLNLTTQFQWRINKIKDYITSWWNLWRPLLINWRSQWKDNAKRLQKKENSRKYLTMHISNDVQELFRGVELSVVKTSQDLYLKAMKIVYIRKSLKQDKLLVSTLPELDENATATQKSGESVLTI